MKMITVNGQNYLGTLQKNEDGSVVVKNALLIGGAKVDGYALSNYLKDQYLGRLETHTFGGAGISFSETPLNDEMVLELDIQQKQMKVAEKMAPKNLVVNEFSSRVGK